MLREEEERLLRVEAEALLRSKQANRCLYMCPRTTI